jgi:hypothetical protein
LIDIPSDEFDALVENALEELPRRFADLLHNVAIVVEEEPSGDDLDLLDDAHNELLGIFRTHPSPPRSSSFAARFCASRAIAATSCAKSGKPSSTSWDTTSGWMMKGWLIEENDEVRGSN